MRVELREVEDVADEPREPVRLGRDHRERLLASTGSVTRPSRSAATWPRMAVSGVRSSCETDMRKFRSSSSASASLAAISRNRDRWPISSRPRRSGTLASYRPSAISSAATRERSTGSVIRRERYSGERARHERARRASASAAARRASASGRAARSSASRRRARRTPARVRRARAGARRRGASCRSRRRELELERRLAGSAPKSIVALGSVPEGATLARGRVTPADVEDAVAGRVLELAARSRRPVLVRRALACSA